MYCKSSDSGGENTAPPPCGRSGDTEQRAACQPLRQDSSPLAERNIFIRRWDAGLRDGAGRRGWVVHRQREKAVCCGEVDGQQPHVDQLHNIGVAGR